MKMFEVCTLGGLTCSAVMGFYFLLIGISFAQLLSVSVTALFWLIFYINFSSLEDLNKKEVKNE